MKNISHYVIVCAVFLTLFGCEEQTFETETEIDGAYLHGVYGGKRVTDTDGNYENVSRSVVGLSAETASRATGSGILVAPRLVLTVAHNGKESVDKVIRFGTDSRSPEETVPVTHMDDHSSADIGFWVMERPSTYGVAYGNFSCDLGNDMELYGFGTEGGTSDHTYGPLYRTTCDWKGTGPFESSANGWYFTGNCEGNSHGEGGDSGGPVLNSDLEIVGLHRSHSSSSDTIAMSVCDYLDWIQDKIDLYKTSQKVGDFDGDGRGDLFFWNQHNKGNWVDVSDGLYPDAEADNAPVPWCKKKLLLGDFNGNGRTDLLCYNKDNDRMYIDYADSDGVFLGTNKIIESNWCNGDLYPGDFNGDGKTDLYCRETGSNWRRVDLNNGSSSRFTGSDWQVNSGWCKQEIYIGDYNGDGRDDILCRNPGYRMYVKYATKAGDFSAPHVYQNSSWCQNELRVDDFNGDGVDDLLCWNKDLDNLSIDFANKNESFPFSGSNWKDYDFSWCARQMSTGDMNGDGRADLVCYNPDSGKTFVDFYHPTSKFNGLANLRIPNVDSPVWP